MNNNKEKNKISIYIADNSEFKDSFKKFLENNNEFEVVGSCDDGQTAINQILTTKVDVLLLECILPKSDGFVVMETIAEKMGTNAPKIIVVSSLCHQSFVSKAINLGADYFACKPVDNEVLLGRILEVCNSDNSEKGLVDTVAVGDVKEINTAKTQTKASRVVEEKISNIFITVGIPAHIKGYQFLREAIKMAVEKPDIINSITKKLYPAIAETFSTTSSKVERAIRHAIEVAWNRGKIENINSIFGLKVYTSNEKPTNGEFIALVADKMILEGY